MYCKDCGKLIDDDSKYCRFCGKQLLDSNTQQADSTNQAKEINVNISLFGKSKQQKENKLKIIEENKKYDYSYEKETLASVVGGFVIIINTALIFSGIIVNEGIQIFSIINLIWRIIVTIWIIGIASRQNRQSTNWGLFGFFFPNLALLIIGFLRKLNKEIIKTTTQNTYENKTSIKPSIETFKKHDDDHINELMKKYNIRFENEKYIYETYRYDKVIDAINYAELIESKRKN